MKKNRYKDAAVAFLQLITQGQIRQAVETYANNNFLHHNPHFKADAEDLIKGMEENHRLFPDKTYEVKHVLEDGQLVAVHGLVQLSPGGKRVALVHILRFEHDKIAEIWDIGEEVPQNSPNEHGMF